MNAQDYMEQCQYEFDDIRNRIETRLLRRNVNLRAMELAPHIDMIADNLLAVFYVNLGKINNVNIGFYITNEHLMWWNISRVELLDSIAINYVENNYDNEGMGES